MERDRKKFMNIITAYFEIDINFIPLSRNIYNFNPLYFNEPERKKAKVIHIQDPTWKSMMTNEKNPPVMDLWESLEREMFNE